MSPIQYSLSRIGDNVFPMTITVSAMVETDFFLANGLSPMADSMFPMAVNRFPLVNGLSWTSYSMTWTSYNVFLVVITVSALTFTSPPDPLSQKEGAPDKS